MKKKLLPILLSLLIIVTFVFAITATSAVVNVPEASGGKNETIYVNLDNTGKVDLINVVNSFANVNGNIIDYGKYDSIVNLTDLQTPKISGDCIEFNNNESGAAFYYQGKMKNTFPLPWLFSFEYYLDGNKIDAASLQGAEGRLKLVLTVVPNRDQGAYFSDNYILQINIPFNIDKCSVISSPGASIMVAGSTMTLAYTILAGGTGNFEAEADIHDFKMDPITISAIKAANMADTIINLTDGLSAMIAGTQNLKTGMNELSGGISDLKEGISHAHAGSSSFNSFLNDFGTGLTNFAAGIPALAAGSANVNSGLKDIASNGTQIHESLKQIEGIPSSMLDNKDQLYPLASSLVMSPDPAVKALAEAMLAQLGGLDALYGNLKSINDGLGFYISGIKQLYTEYGSLDNGIGGIAKGAAELANNFNLIEDGAAKITDGLSALKDGSNLLNENVSTIPAKVQLMLDGQTEFKRNTETMLSGNGASNPPSFVSPGKAQPETVQFLFITPGVELPEITKDIPIVKPARKSFWQRLMHLFR